MVFQLNALRLFVPFCYPLLRPFVKFWTLVVQIYSCGISWTMKEFSGRPYRAHAWVVGTTKMNFMFVVLWVKRDYKVIYSTHDFKKSSFTRRTFLLGKRERVNEDEMRPERWESASEDIWCTSTSLELGKLFSTLNCMPPPVRIMSSPCCHPHIMVFLWSPGSRHALKFLDIYPLNKTLASFVAVLSSWCLHRRAFL